MAERDAQRQLAELLEVQLQGGSDAGGVGKYLLHRAKPHVPRGSGGPVPEWSGRWGTGSGARASRPASA
ncbi:hypothetical protein Srufu_037490 [Streptomyces libani subsp. rufus]|nr:hypothetical protein Srufu_037490 [Streptomyces libani subsp. rufus]